MRANRVYSLSFSILSILVAQPSLAAVSDTKPQTMKVDPVHVQTWNAFADSVYALHRHQLSQHAIRTTERVGGYAEGYLGGPDFYREVRYYDASTNRLLSRIQWERAHPDIIHMIEVMVYDDKGRVERDYLAAFLPRFRNAPVQTLINFHNYEEGLHSFRQFDASGNRIYEQCQGSYFGDRVFLSLEETDLPPFSNDHTLLDSPAYLACFENVPLTAGPYLNPRNEFEQAGTRFGMLDGEADSKIRALTRDIERTPTAALYLARGQVYFQVHQFDQALADFDAAGAREGALPEAQFWRGMVLGRMGRLDESIAALDDYIKQNPSDSLAYTKRGVRRIWNGDLEQAEADLRQAIALDANNAEAHDDLGVLYAQRKQYAQALAHFERTVSIDPSYQKGHHNKAMVLYLTGQLEPALRVVSESQRLAPNNRGTLLLKGQILQALGRGDQARALFERAEFMPEDKDWTEQFAVQ